MESIFKYLTFQSIFRSLQISPHVIRHHAKLSNKIFFRHNVAHLHLTNQLCNTQVECVVVLSLLSKIILDISRLLLILFWSFLKDILLLKGGIVLDSKLSMLEFVLLFDRICLEDILFSIVDFILDFRSSMSELFIIRWYVENFLIIW